MGKDKGMLIKDELPWARIVGHVFEQLGVDYHLSINESQLAHYEDFFESAELIVDNVDVPGPLRGIFSAHLAFPTYNWIVMACDMIEMTAAPVSQIIELANQNADYDFWIYKNEVFFEPFCGIYSARGVSKLLEDYRQGNLARFSMQYVFEQSKVFTSSSIPYAAAFRNFNQH